VYPYGADARRAFSVNARAGYVQTIAGALTQMSSYDGVALDGSGNIDVANDNGTDTVTVYTAGSNGDVAPIRSIMGTSTQPNGPGGIAIR
jgi:hypothetical protein